MRAHRPSWLAVPACLLFLLAGCPDDGAVSSDTASSGDVTPSVDVARDASADAMVADGKPADADTTSDLGRDTERIDAISPDGSETMDVGPMDVGPEDAGPDAQEQA